MHRNVTALYRSAAEAEVARRELSAIGVASGDVRVVPDAGDRVADVGLGGGDASLDALRDLDLPDEDARGYAERIARGAVLVSVSVDPAMVSRVEDILREPTDLAQLRQSGLAPQDPGPLSTPRDPGPLEGPLDAPRGDASLIPTAPPPRR